MGVQEQVMMGGVLCGPHRKWPVTRVKGFTGCRVFIALVLNVLCVLLAWPTKPPKWSNCVTGRGSADL